MNLQDEIKTLKQRIAELEQQPEQEKEEQEFQPDRDYYWFMSDSGEVVDGKWDGFSFGIDRLEIDNIFQTKEQAEFAVEKLKVEAELRKFSRPFKEDEYNYFIEIHLFDKALAIDGSEYFHTQGTIYFESAEKARQAIEAVGEDRIKKYIFGMED